MFDLRMSIPLLYIYDVSFDFYYSWFLEVSFRIALLHTSHNASGLETNI